MSIKEKNPKINELIEKEKIRQVEGVELIASENYTSEGVMEAMGSVLTNKYCERSLDFSFIRMTNSNQT